LTPRPEVAKYRKKGGALEAILEEDTEEDRDTPIRDFVEWRVRPLLWDLKNEPRRWLGKLLVRIAVFVSPMCSLQDLVLFSFWKSATKYSESDWELFPVRFGTATKFAQELEKNIAAAEYLLEGSDRDLDAIPMEVFEKDGKKLTDALNSLNDREMEACQTLEKEMFGITMSLSD
jgi:hypothetical protein